MISVNRYIPFLLLISHVVLFHDGLRNNNVTLYTVLLSNLLMFVAFLVLRNKDEQISAFHISKAIVIQSLVQYSIYLYIYFFGHMHAQDLMGMRIPLVFYQICFGLNCDFLFSRYFKIPFTFKYYIFTLVLSLNLFIWIRELYWQLLVIFCAIAIKTWVTWKKVDSGKHIFNPSGVILALLSVIILFTGSEGKVLGDSIGNLFLRTPGFDIFLMTVAVITLWIPNSFSIFIGTATFFLFANFVSIQFLGSPLIKLFASGSVLLGMTLLVTDPRTSPKSITGKYFFGVGYAISMVVAQEILFYFGKHLYYNKILFLPILNLTVPLFDRYFGNMKLPEWKPNTLRAIMLAVYVIVGGLSYYEQRKPAYENTLAESKIRRHKPLVKK